MNERPLARLKSQPTTASPTYVPINTTHPRQHKNMVGHSSTYISTNFVMTPWSGPCSTQSATNIASGADARIAYMVERPRLHNRW